MVETTQRKTMKSQEKSEKDQSKKKSSMTPLQKNQARAKQILKNEAVEQNTRRQRQIDQYVEMKMIKGHSKEDAERMAKEQITTKEL
tara:strand:+ start:80 stop:340 length:261 start_codon:yes stop_codon:yes gene_type:complete